MEPSRAGAPASRLAAGLLLAAVLAAAWYARLPVAAVEWRSAFCDSDSLYQLHRVRGCLADFPRVESIDSYSHYPRGYRVHWMPLPTVLYAGAARLAGLDGADLEQLAAWLSWIPPAFGVVAVLLALAIARHFTRDRLCLLAIGLLCALGTDAGRVFSFGIIDHHLFAHVGVLLMVWGVLSGRLAAWILGVAALVAMTPEAIIYVSWLLGCLFVTAAVDSRRSRASWAWYASPAIVALAAWWIGRQLETAPLPPSDVRWMYPTLFAPAWYAVLGGSMALARTVLGAPASGWRLASAVGVVALAAVIFLAWSGALETALTRFLGAGRRLFVAEEASPFHAGFWSVSAWQRLLAVAGAGAGVELVAALRPGGGPRERFGWLVLFGAFVLGGLEFRHLYVLASLQLIGVGLVSFSIARRLGRLSLFAGRRRALPAIVVFAVVALPFAAREVASRRSAGGGVCGDLLFLEEIAGWLRRATPPPATAGAPSYGIFAAWAIGHHLRVLGERPVVVDPFNYEYDGWVDEALERVWHAATAEELVRSLRAYGVRYLVLTNPAFEIADTLGPLDPSAEDLVVRGPGDRVDFRPAMSRYASFRLFMTTGDAPEFGALRLRYSTADGETYTARVDGEESPVVIPRGQIYELVAEE